MNIGEVINKIEHLPKLHEKNNLYYIKKILTFLGNPQDKVKTIHVTGTNGKGSTSYYLANLLKKAGYRTGLFVSPYIVKFNERIQIDTLSISDEDLIEGYLVIDKAIKALQEADPDFNLVTFEFETALAFWIFAHKKCEYAVIEVGIGGQHDKTNVINPEVSIITTIGLDHEQIIGPTIFDIAKEKSGIIKKNTPVVLGNIPQTVLPILEKKASQEHAPLYLLGRDFKVTRNKQIIFKNHDYELRFKWRSLVEGYDMAMAVQTLDLLKIYIAQEKIEQAVDETRIPGRYEIISQKPKIVLDGAHNIQAMSNLLESIRKHNTGQIFYLVGMMKDKDLQEVFDLFLPTEKIILTRIDYPRAAELKDFPQEIRERASYYSDFKKAFSNIRKILKKEDTLVVTGSFYLVGAVINYLGEQNESSRHR